MNSNAETIDGNPVDFYEGKFSGSFELPPEFAGELKMHDVGVALVTYTVGAPSYKESKKSGEITRVLTFEVMGWSEVDAALAGNLVGNTNPVVVTVP